MSDSSAREEPGEEFNLNTSFRLFFPFLRLSHVRILCCKTAVRLQLEGAVASWLVRSSSDRAVQVRALAWGLDISSCSWARLLDLMISAWGVEIFLVA